MCLYVCYRCSDVHLICINDLSSLIVCLNLLICELVFHYVCIVSCNLSKYTFVMCKVKGYILTYLLTYLKLIKRTPARWAKICQSSIFLHHHNEVYYLTLTMTLTLAVVDKRDNNRRQPGLWRCGKIKSTK